MREAALQDNTKWTKRLVGFEFENPLVRPDGEPATAADMRRLWEEGAKRGWQLDIDTGTGTVLGGTKNILGHIVTAGHDIGAGNFELALPPLQDVESAQKLLVAAHGELLPLFREYGLSLLALGMQPGGVPKDIAELRYPWSLIDAQLRLGSARYANSGIGTVISAHQANVSARLGELIEQTNSLNAITGLIV